MLERRKYLRKSTAALLELISNVSKRVFGRGFVTNLSEGGVALETSKNLHRGEKLVLHFMLPDNNEFEVPGEIVYAREGILNHAYGARFENGDMDKEERLKSFIGTGDARN